MIRRLFFFILILAAAVGGALYILKMPVKNKATARIEFRNRSYDVYRADLKKLRLGMFWKDSSGQRIGTIGNLRIILAKEGKKLLFATNGGMFMEDGSPLGLFIAHGKMLAPLNRRKGKSNFYIEPNGIFMTKGQHCGIIKTPLLNEKLKEADFATQSGPMLIENGRINTAFNRNSENRNIRSGVGILSDHEAVFAISNDPVTFYEFSQFLRDRFGCTEALFLDGGISEMYLPEIKRFESMQQFGPIIAVYK